MRLLLLSAAMLAAQHGAAQAPVVLRYDLQRTLDESAPARRARSPLQVRWRALQRRLDALSVRLRTLRARIEEDLIHDRRASPRDMERFQALASLAREQCEKYQASLDELEQWQLRRLRACVGREAEALRVHRHAASIAEGGDVGEDVTAELIDRINRHGCREIDRPH